MLRLLPTERVLPRNLTEGRGTWEHLGEGPQDQDITPHTPTTDNTDREDLSTDILLSRGSLLGEGILLRSVFPQDRLFLRPEVPPQL